MTKKTYKVNGMDCTSCAMLIESDLEDAGVNAICSYARSTLDVEYDESRISDEKIIKVVKASGYELSSHEKYY